VRDIAQRELTLRSLRPERGLALEMAVDERAEVEELERQWREAEELPRSPTERSGRRPRSKRIAATQNRRGDQPSG